MIGRRWVLPGMLALLAGCASPEPNYYTLAARPGVVQPNGVKLVEMRQIGLAGYLDRPEIVRNQGDNRLQIGSRDRWGEPLGGLVARTLAEDLSLRLPGSSVFTSSGSISADPDATLELDLQRFDADVTGQVVLLAQVAVTRSGHHDTSGTRSVRILVAPEGPGTTPLVAAMSQALGQLADRIAPLLTASGAGGVPARVAKGKSGAERVVRRGRHP